VSSFPKPYVEGKYFYLDVIEYSISPQMREEVFEFSKHGATFFELL